MSGPTHTDLSRDFGKMEAGLEALEKVVKQGFTDVKDELKAIKSDVELLKADRLERKGAMKTVAIVAAACGSIFTIGWKLLLAAFGH
jgi:hypothetical protein